MVRPACGFCEPVRVRDHPLATWKSVQDVQGCGGQKGPSGGRSADRSGSWHDAHPAALGPDAAVRLCRLRSVCGPLRDRHRTHATRPLVVLPFTQRPRT